MKPITKLILILLLTFTVVPTNAGNLTGNELLEHCGVGGKKEDPIHYFQYRAYCTGYIEGVTDGIYYTQTINLFCVPNKVTVGQIMKVVTKYLNENPQRLHENYVPLILSAMREAFPCKSDFNN